MAVKQYSLNQTLQEIVQNQLKPVVRRVDEEAYYPEEFFREIGRSGLLNRQGVPEAEILLDGLHLIEKTAQTCMTTAFSFWCHLAALTYIRNSSNDFLKNEILPKLETAELRGGTGLSNPLKYNAGLEKLCLKAKRVPGGYVVSGQLPSVSNVGQDAWFGIIASVEKGDRIMAMVPCQADHLVLKERRNFLGLNGSATYTCVFRDVFVPDLWLISERADEFVQQVRAIFLLYQIPLGLGVTEASIRWIEKTKNKQGGCNQYLPVQADDLDQKFQSLCRKTYQLAEADDLADRWMDLLRVRLKVTYLTSQAVHAAMLHHGGGGYLQYSDSSRRLRESYFLVNLTPTVKHLEKLLKNPVSL